MRMSKSVKSVLNLSPLELSYRVSKRNVSFRNSGAIYPRQSLRLRTTWARSKQNWHY